MYSRGEISMESVAKSMKSIAGFSLFIQLMPPFFFHAETNSSTRFIEKWGVGSRGSSEFVRPKIDSKDYFEGYREGEREEDRWVAINDAFEGGRLIPLD